MSNTLEAEAEKAVKDDKKFDIVVSYNGVNQALTVHVQHEIRQVLEKAIKELGNPPQSENLGLFTEAGQELNPGQTVQQVGLQPGQKVLLRARQVRGG